jgi:4-hydroxybenzoate polyprenyltransferase
VGVRDYVGLAAIVLALACAGGIATVLNDVFDREKDATTAPELPLPSGIVSLPLAAGALGALTCAFLAASAAASASPAAYAAAIAVSIAAGAAIGAYSGLKGHPALASMLAACGYASVPLLAWCAAGGGSAQPLLEVLAYAALFGLATNTYTGAQDMRRDPEVGNLSLAVTLGLRRAFLLAAGCDLLGVLCVLAAALYLGRTAVGVAGALFSLTLIGGSHVLAARTRRGADAAGRADWVQRTRFVTLARLVTQVAFLAVFSVAAAAVLTALLGTALAGLIVGYRRRVVLGELRRALQP